MVWEPSEKLAVVVAHTPPGLVSSSRDHFRQELIHRAKGADPGKGRKASERDPALFSPPEAPQAWRQPAL
ncbi:hypothetical protein ACOMHN_048681 [Nucella lapillus]